MEFKEYQIAARRTSGIRLEYMQRENILMAALGLSGETGELNDHLKKVFYHGHEMDKQVVEKELGDILWYIAEMCSAFGFSLDEVAQANIYKLQLRYPDGFSSQASINRSE